MNILKTRFSFPSLGGYYCILVYYVISFISIIEKLHSYVYTDYSPVGDTQSYLYRWIPSGTDLNQWLSFICPLLMLCFVFLFIFIRHRPARILWALLFFIVEGFSFSYVLSHQVHMQVWINLFFAFVPGVLSKDQKEDFYAPSIYAAQLQIFLIYGLSGYWKLLALIEAFYNPNIVSGLEYIPYAVTWEFINSNKAYPASLWIIQQPLLCLGLSFLVLFAQIGSIFAVFFPRIYFLWGLLLVGFHIGTLITLNVFFSWSVYPILLFLCLYEKTRSASAAHV